MSTPGSGHLLQAAHRAASQLSEQAIFAGGLCNWVGAAVREGPAGTVIVDHRALDPTVYEGTSGIGLFLAEVAHATGDGDLAPTAAAAVRQSLDRAEEEPPSLSFYSGTLGIVAVAARVAALLDAENLAAQASGQRRRLAAASVPHGFDLLSGAAGGVLGLLAIGAGQGEQLLLDQATRCGQRLLETSRRTPAGRSWANDAVPAQADLTGLSHGASGGAVALAALFRATGEETYQVAAREALAYEHSLFHPDVGNWPDLRITRAASNRRQLPRTFTSFWCHGAPGIAAARLEMLDLLDPDLADETAHALLTTARAVQRMLAAQDNYCVCHGLTGNAEVLLLARMRDGGKKLLGGVPVELPEEAAAACERHVASGQPWPTGIYGGRNPSLFLGSAGIGRFLLRLYDPQLPTLLLPPPSSQPSHNSI
jgi:lantibiotic biosynthesis protein